MTQVVNIHEAKAHLSELLAKVEAGATLTIARRNKPIAKLVPTTAEAPTKPPRPLGLARNEFSIPDDFFAPMDSELLELFNAEKQNTDDPLHPDWQPTP